MRRNRPLRLASRGPLRAGLAACVLLACQAETPKPAPTTNEAASPGAGTPSADANADANADDAELLLHTDGPDGAARYATIDGAATPGAPRSALASAYPKAAPASIVERWNESRGVDLADPTVAESVEIRHCLVSMHPDTTVADFDALVKAAEAAGMVRQEDAPPEMAMLADPGQERADLRIYPESNPEVPSGTMTVERCESLTPEAANEPMHAFAELDWRLEPVRSLAAALDARPTEIFLGREGEAITAGGSVPFGVKDRSTVEQWVRSHGFTPTPANHSYAVTQAEHTIDAVFSRFAGRALLVLKVSKG